jgi:hypothetical protein
MVRYRYGAALVVLLGLASAQTVYTNAGGAPSGACTGPKMWLSQSAPMSAMCCIGETWTACPPTPSAASSTLPGGVRVTSVSATNVLNDTVSAVNITGLAFPVLANTKYNFDCLVAHSGAANNGPRFGISGPSAPTAVAIKWYKPQSATNDFIVTDVAFSATATTAAVTTGGPTTVVLTKCHGILDNGANAGTVQMHLTASATSSNVVVYGGSYCDIRP